MLWYDVANDADTVSHVELWYTADRGKTWQNWTRDADPVGPLSFDAASDELYGFYIILHNDAGASAQPPAPGTAPQQWVRVDRTMPVIQALAVRPDPKFLINRLIHLRWNATDDDLPDRPVVIHYRTADTKVFKLVADALPARGAYDWAVADDLSGRLQIKLSATDRAGNVGAYLAEPLRISAKSAPTSAPASEEPAPSANGDKGQRGNQHVDLASLHDAAYGEPDAGAAATSKEARAKYEAGTWHRLRGEYAQAATRFKEALDLDPKLLPARCDLAGVMLLRGDTDAAQRELQRVLAADPACRPALKGLALIQAKLRNYQSARETLDKVLLLDPRDAEAWLAFGDVMMFSGDRAAARQAWTKAESLADPGDIKDRATRRLSLYPGS